MAVQGAVGGGNANRPEIWELIRNRRSGSVSKALCLIDGHYRRHCRFPVGSCGHERPIDHSSSAPDEGASRPYAELELTEPRQVGGRRDARALPNERGGRSEGAGGASRLDCRMDKLVSCELRGKEPRMTERAVHDVSIRNPDVGDHSRPLNVAR